MQPLLTIRRAEARDADALARLRWDSSAEFGDVAPKQLEPFQDAFRAFWATAMATGTWCCWIAEREQQILTTVFVQLVGMVPRPGQIGRRYGYVAGVYTRPEARSQGIGSEAMQRLIGWAVEEGLEFLVLSPTEDSVDFYRRLGFQASGDYFELDLDSDVLALREGRGSQGPDVPQ